MAAAPLHAALSEAEKALDECCDPLLALELAYNAATLYSSLPSDAVGPREWHCLRGSLYDVLYRLALLCSQHQERQDDADAVLNALGDTDTAPPPPPLRLLSDVLPTPLLEHLRQSFAPDARYWSEHHYYDPATPFFSYLAPLDQESRPTGSVEQAIGAVYNALRSTPSTAEWMRGVRWVHGRTHEGGHQLHFDANECLFHAGAYAYGLQHPAASSILFLDDGCGGPTLITDQVLGGGLGTRGYLCRPRRGTLVTYAGNVLHGVLPGVRGDGQHTEGRRRLTLVMTWWRDTASDARGSATAVAQQPCVGPRMAWPLCDAPWTSAFALRQQGWGEARPIEEAPPQCCSPVWVPVPQQQPRGGSERSWPKLCEEPGGPLHDEGAGMRCFLHSPLQFEHLYIPPR